MVTWLMQNQLGETGVWGQLGFQPGETHGGIGAPKVKGKIGLNSHKFFREGAPVFDFNLPSSFNLHLFFFSQAHFFIKIP